MEKLQVKLWPLRLQMQCSFYYTTSYCKAAIVQFWKEKEESLKGVMIMGTKRSATASAYSFEKGQKGWVCEPSSQQSLLQLIWKWYVFKSKEPEKIIHTKNKLCHESFDFAFPWIHSLCLGKAKAKGTSDCCRPAERLFKGFHIPYVPTGPHGLDQGLCPWGLTICYCCHGCVSVIVHVLSRWPESHWFTIQKVSGYEPAYVVVIVSEAMHKTGTILCVCVLRYVSAKKERNTKGKAAS